MSVRSAPWSELDAGTLHDVVRLRVDVFVVEQGCPYPEFDGRDVEPGSEHVWTADDAGVTSYLRVLREPDGDLRVGRVVTRADARGRGLSGALLQHVLRAHTRASVVLDAQAHLTDFYARHGFAATGPQFLEDGIPHVPMRRPAGVRTPRAPGRLEA